MCDVIFPVSTDSTSDFVIVYVPGGVVHSSVFESLYLKYLAVLAVPVTFNFGIVTFLAPIVNAAEPVTSPVCVAFGIVFLNVSVPPLVVLVSSTSIPVLCANVTVCPLVTSAVSVPLPSLIFHIDIVPYGCEWFALSYAVLTAFDDAATVDDVDDIESDIAL